MKTKTAEEQVADRILELLDQGELPPWERPWATLTTGLQCNLMSERDYRGINQWMTQLTALACGYDDPRWLTFKQAKTLGGSVNKGEKGTMIIFWKMPDAKDDETEDDKAKIVYPIMRAYHVFNVMQTHDCDIPPLPTPDLADHDPIEAAERIIAQMPNSPDFKTDLATNQPPRYNTVRDTVTVPHMSRYARRELYYNSVFHELVHATGHPTRNHRFEPETLTETLHGYGREELVAGMGSAMVCSHAGILRETVEDAAAYVQHWKKTISADKSIVLRAAQQAQKAVDYIMGANPATT